MKSLKKTIAIIMVMLTVLSVCSAAFPVFAQSSSDVTVNNSKSEVTVVSESYADRSERSKTFVMSDGSFQKAVYSYPVHYLDDGGNWVEYDNSIVKKKSDADENDVFAQTTVYKTNNQNNNVTFAENTQAKNLAAYENGDYVVSWNFLNANKSKVKVAEVNSGSESNDTSFALKNASSEAIYEDIFDNVNLQYVVETSGMKENIILKSIDAPNEFTVRYNIGELSVRIVNEKTIELIDDNSQVVYTISAPYMYDSNWETNDNVELSVVKNIDGVLEVVLTADKAWLNDSDRVYPVTIDPSILTEEHKDCTATYVSSKNPTANYSAEDLVYISTGSQTLGTSYALVKIDGIFDSESAATLVGDHTVSVNLNLPIEAAPSQTATAHLYEITNQWDEKTVTWNNKPATSNLIADYANISSTYKDLSFDITKLYDKWMEAILTGGTDGSAANNGIMIKLADNQTVSLKKSSADTPILTIKYINTIGIDSDFSYTQFDMGSVGSVYVNNLSGNLVLQRNDISSTGDYEPYDLSTTYNSYMGIENDLNNVSQWRTSDRCGFNILGFLYICEDGSTRIFESEKIEGEEYTYKLIDDEFGWEKLKFTEVQTITFPLPFGSYTMHFPVAFDAWKNDGTERYSFDLSGLNKKVINIEDPNAEPDTPKGGETVFERVPAENVDENSDENDNTYAYCIADGSKNKLRIQENDNERVITQIDVKQGEEDVEREKVIYKYDSNKNVVQIKRNNEVEASFTYDGNNRMTSITDSDNHKIAFTYNGNSGRIASVEESYDGAVGQKISFENRSVDSVVLRSSGADSVHGNNDDVLTTYSFNNEVKCIGERSETVSGEDLGAVSYEYNSDANSKKSEITKISSVGRNAANLLKNHNVESAANWTARYLDDPNCSYTASYSTEKAYVGNGSLKIKVNSLSTTGGASYSQNFMTSDGLVQAGKTYTASAYVNVASMQRQSVVDATRDHGAVIMLRSEMADGSSQRAYSQFVRSTDANVDNGWERVHVRVKIPDGATKVTLYLIVRNAVGTAYFDAVQLEESDCLSQYNMLENNSFAYTDTNNYAVDWKRHNLVSSDVVSNGQMKINGDMKNNKGVYQDVYLDETIDPDTTYIVSGWSNANAVPKVASRAYLIYATVYYKEKNSSGTQYNYQQLQTLFNCETAEKQYTCGSFSLRHPTIPDLTPEKIRIVACYYKQANTCLFDSLCLVKSNDVYDMTDDGESDETQDDTSYKYDAQGNIIEYTDENGVVYTYEPYDSDGDGVNDESVCTSESYENGSTVAYEYDNDWNLIKETSVADGVTTVKTYDSEGKLKTESATPGKSYTYTYDAMGNLVSKLTEDGTGDTYEYEYYDSDGDEVDDKSVCISESYEDGSTVAYGYDDEWNITSETTVVDGVTTVKTYTYDAKGNLTHETTSKGGKSLGYTYNAKGQLGSVDHNGFKYNYAYDAFGNTTAVKVNNQPLVTYGYQPNNGKLNSTTYGNGSKETYTYNAYGEMTKKSQAGVGTFTYIHDTQGRKYYETDSASNLKTYYTYDDKGRLANEKVFTNESNVLYNDKYSVSYNYDNEGRVTKNTLRSRPASISSTFSYDENGNNNVNALTSVRSIQFAYDADKRMTGRTLNLDTPIAETFTYNEDESIGTHKINNNVYAYTYDEKGNISEIKKNGATVQSFVYDEDNQLIRDNNVETNKTTVYSYDNAGNIANKKEYAYTTGEPATATSTVNYAYDETWKDKLTSYNGESISYDAIGNPTTYRGATATWFGRQMQSYTKGNTAVTYSYNSDGLRTKKIVNGVTYEYYYVDGQLAYEKKGDEYELFYRYDADCRLAMVVKNRLSDNYKSYCYVVTNTRGDVLELHNGPGDLIAKYTYDAWGKLISVTNANGSALAKTNLAYQISVRYRSYVYDEETGLYYLQSRYYDPETGRFINADDVNYIGADKTVLSYNTFTYCKNDSVNDSDSTGYFAKWIYNKFNSFKKRIVAIGIQFECAASMLGVGIGVGIELLYFTHLKRWQAYGYFPKSVSIDRGDLKTILNKASSNLKKPNNLFKSSLSGSLSISAVIVYSNKGQSFKTNGYLGKFRTYSFSIKNMKCFYSKGDGCYAVGAGGQISSGLLNLSYSYSESNYFYANDLLRYVQALLKNCYNTIYKYAAKNVLNRK